MKRILVPTDFSPQAELALKVAVQIAKKNNSEIYLLHSLEMPLHLGNSGGTGSLPESLYFIKLAENNFEDLFKKPFLKGVKIKEAIGHAEIYEDAAEAVRTHNIDLIIMGSHGASGFKEMFIGSNTEKVVRTSEPPVLVIKNNHQDFKVDNFVFATDFSEECIESFKKAKRFAEVTGAKLHMLLVNTPNDFRTTTEANKLMSDFIKDLTIDNYTMNVYNDTSVEKGILNFAKDVKAELIGMSTHGRKGLSHFFNGSISEDLVNHANMPVITFKIK